MSSSNLAIDRRRLYRRWFIAALLPIAAALCAVPLTVEVAARLRSSVDISRTTDLSPIVLGRHGEWINAGLSKDEKWRFPTDTDAVPTLYLDLLLAYEDHRFWQHGGVSYLALIRALADALRYGRVVSGASTIPMQVARLLEGQPEGVYGKLRQMIAARRLSIDYEAEQILEFYLKLAPFGGNIEGIEAASTWYFGTRASELTPGQAALLVAIPQAPERRRLDLTSNSARAARNHVLIRAANTGVITDELAEALSETSIRKRIWPPLTRIPHLLHALEATSTPGPVWQTTIDGQLQDTFRQQLRKALESLPPKANAAGLVIETKTGAIRAKIANARDLEGSTGYLDLTLALRSPGSALKPFVYGMAFDQNLAHPYTLFHDRPARYGAFSPRNFGEHDTGPITLRDALASSLNTAAVAVTHKLGADRFVARLQENGAQLILPQGTDEAGLAVALGGLGITLTDLAALYAAMANGGAPVPLHLLDSRKPEHQPSSLFDAEAAAVVTQALANAAPPESDFPLTAANGAARIAYKTGTSSGRRDVWAIGYDADHTVAVWIGRPDNAGMPSVTGRMTAAPVLWSMFRALPEPEKGVSQIAIENPTHLSSTTPPARLRVLGENLLLPRVEIHFPSKSGTLRRPESATHVTIKLSGGMPPFTWMVNGHLAHTGTEPTLRVPAPKGLLSVQVSDTRGDTDALEIWVE